MFRCHMDVGMSILGRMSYDSGFALILLKVEQLSSRAECNQDDGDFKNPSVQKFKSLADGPRFL